MVEDWVSSSVYSREKNSYSDSAANTMLRSSVPSFVLAGGDIKSTLQLRENSPD